VSAPIRVLHLFSGDLWAGAEVVVAHLLEQLGKTAVVEPIALGFNDGVLVRRLAQGDVETHLVGEDGRGFTRLAWQCRALLRGRRIDVVHAHRYKENLLAAVVARLLGARCTVTTVHGVPEVSPAAPVRERILHAMDRLNVRTTFDAVVAVSAQMRTVLVERFGVRPDRVRVIENGIDIPSAVEAMDGEEADDIHVGTVGRLVPVKGYRLFLELAAELHVRYPRVRFSILGDGPMATALKENAARLGIAGHVAFLPPRPAPESYYRELDIYVNTSLHEGMPLSVLEAMAHGKPVVAPRVGGIPEAVHHGEHGLLVEGRSVAAFSACCARLIEDRVLRRTMGRQARARVAALFGRDRMADRYRALYQELCMVPTPALVEALE
jgi:L-malate glycosyltransferase